jgi:DHA1 family inner membrane transport protein
MVIAAGFGYTAPNWVGAALAGSALLLAVLSAGLERRTAPVTAQPAATVRGANRRVQSPGTSVMP